MSIVVPGSANVRNRNADSLSIEYPSKRAFKTDCSFPDFASDIRDRGIGERSLNAGTIIKIISVVTGQTVAILKVPGLALAVDELADAIGVKVSSEGAFIASTVGEVFAVGVGRV